MNNYQHEHVHLLIWNGNLWSVWFRARRNWVGSNNFQKIDFHEVMTATEGDICYNQIKISSFRSQSSNYIYGKRNVEREKESKKKMLSEREGGDPPQERNCFGASFSPRPHDHRRPHKMRPHYLKSWLCRRPHETWFRHNIYTTVNFATLMSLFECCFFGETIKMYKLTNPIFTISVWVLSSLNFLVVL